MNCNLGLLSFRWRLSSWNLLARIYAIEIPRSPRSSEISNLFSPNTARQRLQLPTENENRGLCSDPLDLDKKHIRNWNDRSACKPRKAVRSFDTRSVVRGTRYRETVKSRGSRLFGKVIIGHRLNDVWAGSPTETQLASGQKDGAKKTQAAGALQVLCFRPSVINIAIDTVGKMLAVTGRQRGRR